MYDLDDSQHARNINLNHFNHNVSDYRVKQNLRIGLNIKFLLLYFLFLGLFSYSHARSDVFYDKDYSIQNFNSPLLEYNLCELIAKSYYANCTNGDLFKQMTDLLNSFLTNLFGSKSDTSCISQTTKLFFNCSEIYESNLTEYEKKMLIANYLINESGPEMSLKINKINSIILERINSDLGIHRKVAPSNTKVYEGKLFRNTWIKIVYTNNSFVDENNKTWVLFGQKPEFIYNIDFVYFLPEKNEEDCASPTISNKGNYDFTIHTLYDGLETEYFNTTQHGKEVNFTVVLNFNGQFSYKRYHEITVEVCDNQTCWNETRCEPYEITIKETGSISDSKLFTIFGNDIASAYIFTDSKKFYNMNNIGINGFAFVIIPPVYNCILSIYGKNLTISHTLVYPDILDSAPYDFLVHRRNGGFTQLFFPLDLSANSIINLQHDYENNNSNQEAIQLMLDYNVPIEIINLFNHSKIISFIHFNLYSNNISDCSLMCYNIFGTVSTQQISCNYNYSRKSWITIEKKNVSDRYMEVKIKLTDSLNNSLSGKKLKIIYPGFIIDGITDANGEYILNISKGERAILLDVYFDTDGKYMSSSNSIEIDPLPKESEFLFWIKIFIVFGLLYYSYKQILYMYRYI